ncbi:MAG TPA: cupredoxin domain-containing protein [Vicinamibacterales bacterium]|nr:cupredoxin domain-containing protein [Vicinamibacterales bacterium]
MHARRTTFALFGGLGASVLLLLGVAVHAQDQGTVREFTIRAHKYAFAPPRLEVHQNDVVKITLTADDIAHSFTIDAYRIAKRAGVGQTVVFEFRADQAGTFPYYCNLTIDDGCRNMRGQLVVK